MTQGSNNQPSQSDFFAAHADRMAETFSMEAKKGTALSPAAQAPEPSKILPDMAKRLVLWGSLSRVLVTFPDSMLETYKTQSIRALNDIFREKNSRGPLDAAEVIEAQSLVASSYAQYGAPSRALAEKFNVDEISLMMGMLTSVEREDMASNPRSYWQGDHEISNFFNRSEEMGQVHALVTSYTTQFADTALRMAVLRDHFVQRCYGVDAYLGDQGEIVRKDTDSPAILQRVLKDVPADRYKDVLVVDDNPAFLKAASKMGFATYNIAPARNEAGAREAVKHVFRNVLNVPQVETGRNNSLYAAFAGPRNAQSFDVGMP